MGSVLDHPETTSGVVPKKLARPDDVSMTTKALTIKQVAELLQVSPDTVYGLAARGELEGRKIGRIWRFQQAAVDQFMKDETSRGQATVSSPKRGDV